MSDLNFSKWNLDEGKKKKKAARRVSADELTSIILQEIGEDNLGLWNSKYGNEETISDQEADRINWADDVSGEELDGLSHYYSQQDLGDADDAAKELYIQGMESEAFGAEAGEEGAGVTIVDDPYEAGMFEMDGEPEDRSLDGLEGPFDFSGRELYYDNKEEGGQYYDRGTDMYLSDDEASSAVMGAPEVDVSSFSLDEQDEVAAADMDMGVENDSGSFYTGGDDDTGGDDNDMDLDMDEQMSRFLRGAGGGRDLPKAAGKKTDLPSKFRAWFNACNQGTDPRTKAMLAKNVLDSVGIENQDAAIQNLAHWIDYEPSVMADMFVRLKSDAEGGEQMSEQDGMSDDQRSIPEPFWSYGFPQVKLRDIAEAIADSMIPGGDKRHTHELIRIMRSELDDLETKIESEN